MDINGLFMIFYHHLHSFSPDPSVHPNTWQELNYEAGLFMRKIKAHGKLGKLGGLLRWALAIFGVGGSTRKCLKNLNQ